MKDSYTLKSNIEIRFKKISPVRLLALQTALDLNDIEKSEKFFTFVLENAEVKISNEWVSLKEKDRDVYYPVGIDKNLNALNEVIKVFINEVLKPAFTQSRE